MREYTYTLVADGRSDRALMYHLTWLLSEHMPNVAELTAIQALEVDLVQALKSQGRLPA